MILEKRYMQIFLKIYVGFFCITIFQEKHKRKRDKTSGTKRHFYFIDDNLLKQKALDKFTFAWGGAKGFFLKIKT